jgi:hypothetical protein
MARFPRGGQLFFFALFDATKTLHFATDILRGRDYLRTSAINQTHQREKDVSLSLGQSHRRHVIYAQAVHYPR